MSFLVDAQLPPALARFLREHGHEAVHVEEVGLRHAGDGLIWQYALAHNAIIVTKDEDFAHRFHQATLAPVVVWLRVKNVSRKALLEWFEPLLPNIVALIKSDERLIEVI